MITTIEGMSDRELRVLMGEARKLAGTARAGRLMARIAGLDEPTVASGFRRPDDSSA